MDAETPKRRRGRPSPTAPVGRSLETEMAHLRAFLEARPRLSQAGISQDAGLHRNHLRWFVAGTRKPTADQLDAVYRMLTQYGYEPLENAYRFL
jgi:hypothetical protein